MQQRLDAEAREKPPGTFAVIGTGSLGGREMSYGADIDLLYVYDTANASGADASGAREFFVRVGCDLTAALRDDTHDGSLYRVELPAWPQADGWLKACSLAEYTEHYAAADDADERRALTQSAADRRRCRARRAIHGVVSSRSCIARSHAPLALRPAAACPGQSRGPDAEIDALTQAFQLRARRAHSALRHTGTLGALEAMAKAGLIPEPVGRELDHAYVFLRTAEHRAPARTA